MGGSLNLPPLLVKQIGAVNSIVLAQAASSTSSMQLELDHSVSPQALNIYFEREIFLI